ncbi:MAG: NAD(P)-binding protein [Myxococcales bacterium]|nr:NAD(P)-binding protein [Myxococcales bacterium]
MSAPVHILGAGLTGLSAAHHLDVPFQVHERLAHPGGHAITLTERGYRFDRTGHLLHLRDTEMRTWIDSLLAGQTVSIERKSKVYSYGVYTPYPYQANTFGLPADIAYECLMGFLEALASRTHRPAPQNFEEFCLMHFGEGFSKHFMIPYNTKLWGGPEGDHCCRCSRFVPQPTLRRRDSRSSRKNQRVDDNADFTYPVLGIGERFKGHPGRSRNT